MFVNKFCLVLGWLFLAGMGNAQTPKQNASTATAAATSGFKAVAASNTNTLLWEISGKGLTKPSYLFGTMHMLCADDALLSNNMKGIIKNSDVIYLELDMDNMQEVFGSVAYLRMNDGKKLSDLLTKEEYAKVENYFKDNKYPVPMMMLNRFKPMLVSSLIGEGMMDCAKKDGMEERIMQESKQYSKEIKGLETMQFQAGLFDSIPYEKQAKELVNYIDSLDSYRKTNMEMVDVYKKQDLTRMDSLIQKSDPGMDEYLDLLVFGRNRNWIKQMATLMPGKTILFAVGAGHLPGNNGVINLLKKQGYTVKPLQN